jgi:hypothetical protein
MVMIQCEMVALSWTVITKNTAEHSKATHAGGQGWSATGSSAGQPVRAVGPSLLWARSSSALEASPRGRRDKKVRANRHRGAGDSQPVGDRGLNKTLHFGITATPQAGVCEMLKYPNALRDPRLRGHEIVSMFCCPEGCYDRDSSAVNRSGVHRKEVRFDSQISTQARKISVKFRCET